MDKRLTERMVPYEASEAITRMLSAYPNRGKADDSYVAAIKKILMQFPRSVSLDCTDPAIGIARETKFLPTVAEVSKWCERKARPMFDEYDRERRTQELRKSTAWTTEKQNPEIGDRLKALASQLRESNAT